MDERLQKLSCEDVVYQRAWAMLEHTWTVVLARPESEFGSLTEQAKRLAALTHAKPSRERIYREAVGIVKQCVREQRVPMNF